MKKPLHTRTYAMVDLMAAVIAWVVFFGLHRYLGGGDFSFNKKFLVGLILYPIGWLILHHLFGAYKNIYYKSRAMELLSTLISTFIGCTVLFFIFLLYKKHEYLSSFTMNFLFFWIQFFITYFFRLLLLIKRTDNYNAKKSGSIHSSSAVIKKHPNYIIPLSSITKKPVIEFADLLTPENNNYQEIKLLFLTLAILQS